MSKSIEQCIRDGNKDFNNMFKIMLKPEIECIEQMELSLLEETIKHYDEIHKDVDFVILVCPTSCFRYIKYENYLYVIQDKKKTEEVYITECIEKHQDLYTSPHPRDVPLLFNTFIKQTLNKHGFVVEGKYTTDFQDRCIKYGIVKLWHSNLTDIL